MAELAVTAASPIVEMVVKKLASGLWKVLGLATDIKKLQTKLSKIQDVLDDVERKPITSKPLQGTLRKLRDAALDADDVVEEFETEVLRRRMEGYDDLMTGKVRDFFSSNNPIAFRCKMARKIKEIRDRIDEIVKDNKDLDSMVKSDSYNSIKNKSDSDRRVDRETTSLVVEPKIYGRDEDVKKVMEFLVDGDNDKNISILTIVGIGGVGKTTLAQLVYNNERIKEQFELRMWVCVGETFDVIMVLRAMIEQLKGEQSIFSNLQTMSTFLDEKLRTKRFLLVLDDLWNDKELGWEKLKPLFIHAKLGSKIIVTTRIETVASSGASTIGVVSVHKLQGLQDEDCWSLFKQRAFRSEREEDNPELVEIGREIIKKCGGLPLAAKALGSLMSSKRGKVEWLAIKNNEIWITKLSEDVVPVLKLSYDHLPSHLKQCFTYCSMFPKDHVFEIKRLIQLWMAEGLIDMSDISLNAADIGNQHFNDLLWRSFFQDVQMDEHNNPETCKMHDLVHDLASSITKDEALLIEGDTKSISHGCRYLSIGHPYGSSIDLKAIYEAKKLKSLILLEGYNYSNVDLDEFMFNATKTFTRLRALGLRWSGIEKLSDRVSRLKHLRFLDLSSTQITILPTSITRLYNLQTLNLHECGRLKELPEGIGNLCNLRYMDISWCMEITTLPISITKLSSLQSLNLGQCILKELPEGIGNLCNLRYMDISWCMEITTLPTSITRLSSLQSLNLGHCRMLKELPEGIGNLCNLRYMDISGCITITTLPISITKLSSLQTLNLEECTMLEELSEDIGNLCNLRYMDISWCTKITILPTSITRLSSLQTLNLHDCGRLKELPEGIGNLCNLRYIDISRCMEITTLPTSIARLSSLQTLNLPDCCMLKELPEGISNLGNLRHLDISECYNLASTPRGLGRLSNLETLPMFIVAQENGRTVVELQHLNSIRGWLRIKNLHHVKDPDEAMQANLRAKTRLNYLTLEWNGGSDEEHEPSSSTEVEVAEGVLERLQPHHNLEKLSIRYYIGTRLPSWMSSPFPNLVVLTMWDLKRCEHLFPLGPWPSLKDLYLHKLHAVRRIGEEFYGDGDGITFPSLEKLRLHNMPNLEKWHTDSTTTTTGRKMASFPRLTYLSILSCPKLAVQPCIPCSVEKFEITTSNEMLLSAGSLAGLSKLKDLKIVSCGISSSSGHWDGLQYLTALEKLQIEECVDLTCLPDDIMYLPSLQTLHLFGNRNLRSLEGGGRKQQQSTSTPFFIALHHLNIQGAGMLTALPEWVGGLTPLRSLQIERCSNLAMLPNSLQQLTELQELKISDLPQLAMLPDGLQHLTALQDLSISNLPQLAMLPDGLQYLTALQKLQISDLPQLAMLPDDLQHLTALQELRIFDLPRVAMLPDGLQHLTTLRYLKIGNCPQLVTRCERETGEDWHKIAHIRHRDIKQEEEDREEMNERRTFATKFLDKFGLAHCTGRS